MNIKKALKILKEHQMWRRGNIDSVMTDPTLLGIAIDVIINYLKDELMNNKELKKVIKKIIENDDYTTLKLDNEEDDFISFATRENGDVGNEITSDEDYDDAHRMSNILLRRFTGKIKTNIEEVDEWVILNININKEE